MPSSLFRPNMLHVSYLYILKYTLECFFHWVSGYGKQGFRNSLLNWICEWKFEPKVFFTCLVLLECRHVESGLGKLISRFLMVACNVEHIAHYVVLGRQIPTLWIVQISCRYRIDCYRNWFCSIDKGNAIIDGNNRKCRVTCIIYNSILCYCMIRILAMKDHHDGWCYLSEKRNHGNISIGCWF